MFLGIQNAPRKVLLEQHLPLIRSALEELKAGPENYVHKKASYWDDFCLAKFLEGSCLRFVAYPDKDAVHPVTLGWNVFLRRDAGDNVHPQSDGAGDGAGDGENRGAEYFSSFDEFAIAGVK